MQLGSLVFQIGADVQRLSSDMASARSTVQSAAKKIQSDIDTLKAAFGGLAAAFSVDKLLDGFTSTVHELAGMKSMAEQTGTSIARLASEMQTANGAGIGMEGMVQILDKLRVSMLKTATETTAASVAWKELKIDPTKFKDPIDLLHELAKNLNQYGDDAGKAAVATALGGKSFAAALPYLKDLATAGEQMNMITEAQVINADNLEKEWVRLRTEMQLSWIHMSQQMVPTLIEIGQRLNDMVRAGLDWGQLMSAGVFGTDTGEAFARQQYDTLVRIKELQEKSNRTVAENAELFYKNGIRNIKNIDAAISESRVKLEKYYALNKMQAERRQQALADEGPPAPDNRESMQAMSQRIMDAMSKQKSTGKDINDELAKEIEKLKEKAATTLDTTKYMDALYKVEQGKYASASQGLKEELLLQAKNVDMMEAKVKKQKEAAEAEEKILDIINNAQIKENFAAIDLAHSIQEADKKRLDGLLAQTEQAQKAVIEDLRNYVTEKFFGGEVTTREFDELNKVIDNMAAAKDKVQDYAKAMEDAIIQMGKKTADNLTDLLMGGGGSWLDIFKTFTKEVISQTLYEMFIKDAAKSASTGFSKMLMGLISGSGGAGAAGGGGGGTSTAATIAAVIGSGSGYAGGGNVMGNSLSVVGENGPELFAPSRSGRIIPNGALAGGGSTIIVQQTNTFGSGVTRQEVQGMLPAAAAAARNSIANELSRNGPIRREVKR